jgi:penicillin-binding protein 1C
LRRTAAALACGVLAAAALFALDRAYPPGLVRLDAPGTAIRDASGEVLALRPAPGGVWRFRTGAGDVPPFLLRLLVSVEDRRFWAHPGVDPLAAARAAAQAAQAGRIVSGGSTLTMQVARLLNPRPRSLGAKILESLRAMQLSLHHDKQDVLGMWLSLAPFGGNLVGVEAASRAYFGKPAAALDPAEAALLVALPRRPEALRPDRHPERAQALRDRIVMQAAREGLLTAAEAQTAMAEPVPTRRDPMPGTARTLFAGDGGDLLTTLDRPLQLALEARARDELQRLPPRVSLAMMVADLRSRTMLAAAAGDPGSADRAGWLDLTHAVRSPGSALKPFLYALAFEDGIASPGTPLPDGPWRFGGYAPENLDHGFSGQVTAADALRRSLNVPAVALLARYGAQRFASALRGAGLVLPRDAEASLPVALGGAGLSLRRLMALYAALGTDGRLAPLRLLATAPVTEGAALLSPAAAGSVAGILTRPFPGGAGPGGIAWKTGTSAGNRDSWAFGFDRGHLVGVWVGRPDGTARPGGAADVALPILARTFALLASAPRPATPQPTASMLPGLAPGDALRLLFPPPSATIEGGEPVLLRASGGERPLVFLVDGAVLASTPALRDTRWRPPGPGFYHVTVLDAGGHAAQAVVRVTAGR